MAVEFPGRLSYFFISPETAFKRYVTGVCQERGYTDDASWKIRYSYGSQMEATLSIHVQRIFERYAPQLNSYVRTKTLAAVAANNICPHKPSGGCGNQKQLFTLLLMFLGLRNFAGEHLFIRQPAHLISCNQLILPNFSVVPGSIYGAPMPILRLPTPASLIILP